MCHTFFRNSIRFYSTTIKEWICGQYILLCSYQNLLTILYFQRAGFHFVNHSTSKNYIAVLKRMWQWSCAVFHLHNFVLWFASEVLFFLWLISYNSKSKKHGKVGWFDSGLQNSLFWCQMARLFVVSTAVKRYIPFVIVWIKISIAKTLESILIPFISHCQDHVFSSGTVCVK